MICEGADNWLRDLCCAWTGDCFVSNAVFGAPLNATSCNMPCRDKSGETCGGSSAMTVSRFSV